MILWRICHDFVAILGKILSRCCRNFVSILSRFYNEFFRILSQFCQDFVANLSQFLSIFYHLKHLLLFFFQVKVKELYDSIVTKDYYPNLRPYGVNGTDATFVTVQLRDVKILNVDETKGLFTFQTYARKSWIDPRLAYNDTTVRYFNLQKLWSSKNLCMLVLHVQNCPK